jgi:hypothetical protein
LPERFSVSILQALFRECGICSACSKIEQQGFFPANMRDLGVVLSFVHLFRKNNAAKQLFVTNVIGKSERLLHYYKTRFRLCIYILWNMEH